jgi:hypothetical protein
MKDISGPGKKYTIRAKDKDNWGNIRVISWFGQHVRGLQGLIPVVLGILSSFSSTLPLNFNFV